MTPLRLRLARALYAASLWPCPRSIRRATGYDARATFELMARRALQRGGTAGLARLTVLAVLDGIAVALAARRRLRLAPEPSANSDPPSRGARLMLPLLHDARLGLRLLLGRPLFALTSIVTLALGVGVNTAIFSVVNGVLLRPLPFPQPERLVTPYTVATDGERAWAFSYPDLADWTERARSLQAMGLYTTGPSGPLLIGGDEPVELKTAYVTRGFFPTLGRQALLGRTLLDSEERGDNHVVVLAHGFWQRRYGGDAGLVGGTITLDDQPYRVAGVMPADFAFPSRETEAWIFSSVIPPSSIPQELRPVRFMRAVARLAPGVTMAAAAQEIGAVVAALAREFPDDNEGQAGAALQPLHETVAGAVNQPLLILLAGVGVVLLIACVNVAGLLLARGADRQRELALRTALGAGRGRLVRQLMTESAVMSLVGSAAGVALAAAGTPLLMAASADLLPRAAEVRLDAAVLAFAVALSALATALFGLAPALTVTRTAPAESMRADARTAAGGRGMLGSALVAAEVALAVVLVVGAGLLVRGFLALQRVDLGLDADRLLTVSLTINDARYLERPAYLQAYAELMDRLRAVPGVEKVGSIRYLPLRGLGESLPFRIPDRPEPLPGERPEGYLLQVSPGFFEAAGVPVLSGRDVSVEDGPGVAPVVVVNDALRRRYWPSVDPVGRSIEVNGRPVAIVGLVGDVRQAGADADPLPTFYIAQAQNPRRGMAFVLRTAGDPGALVPAVRAAIRQVDPDQPIEQLLPMTEVAGDAIARPRFFATLLSGFGALALALAATGIYGTVATAVARRTREIGVRLALGAEGSRVARMVLVQGMRPVLAGLVAGLLAAAALARSIAGVLHGVGGLDPPTFVLAPLVLVAASALAIWIPAARAATLDPTESLRAE